GQVHPDEYLVRVTNRGPASIELKHFTLRDFRDREVRCSSDPWTLDQAGLAEAWYLNNLRQAKPPAAGPDAQPIEPKESVAEIDSDVSAGGISTKAAGDSSPPPSAASAEWAKSTSSEKGAIVVGGAAISGGLIYVLASPAAGAAVGAAVFLAPVALVAYSPFWLYKKIHHKTEETHAPTADFHFQLAREIGLPITLAPGGSVTGSVFFPLTAGPKRLTAHCLQGERDIQVEVVLKGLQQLHLESVSTAKSGP
ncbi:MAG: hypothetical protein WCR49_11325, partial [Opitutae bacterium]